MNYISFEITTFGINSLSRLALILVSLSRLLILPCIILFKFWHFFTVLHDLHLSLYINIPITYKYIRKYLTVYLIKLIKTKKNTTNVQK